jgi:3-oxoacyl-[acyl-carrier protein] reductase
MELSLKGKTALICGATQGIGLATAKELANLGAECILMARDVEAMQEIIPTLAAEHFQEHSWLVADFSDPRQVEEAIKTATDKQSIHILVNNTGGPAGGPIVEAAVEAFTAAFNQHLVNNHILAQAVITGMIAAGYGRIINVISTSVKTPIKNLGVSNTIRLAVAAWAKTMAGELAQYGITVNNVLPGSTNTRRLRSLINSSAKKKGVDPSVVEQEMLSEIPMKRFGDAKEIAAAIAFLATPAAGYITGTSIPVDGGKTPAF